MANPRTRTRTYKEEGAQSTPNAKGAHLPDGWLPDQSVVDALKAELGKDAGWFKAEHRKFTDHWQAESGQRASKRDWNAAYRLWCRRGAENNVRRIPAPTTAPIDRLWAEAGAEQ